MAIVFVTENAAAVEIRVVVMEDLGAIAVCGHLVGDGLAEIVGDVIKNIAAGGGQIDAAVHAEFGVDGPGTAVAGGVEIGKLDTPVHHII